MSHSDNENQLLSRRDTLKALAAIGGAAALSTLPATWEKPYVKIGTLPAFAQSSPTSYPFTVSSTEIDGGGGELQAYRQPGWTVIAPPNAIQSASYSYPWPSPNPCACFKIKRRRKWTVPGSFPSWWGSMKIDITFGFSPLPGFADDEVPADDVEAWGFVISQFDLFQALTSPNFQYYVVKAKMKKKKMKFTIQLPEISASQFYPCYFSGYFPSKICMSNAVCLSPDYFIAPGFFGDKVKSSRFG